MSNRLMDEVIQSLINLTVAASADLRRLSENPDANSVIANIESAIASANAVIKKAAQADTDTTQENFHAIFSDAYWGLREYYSAHITEDNRASIEATVKNSLQLTGNVNTDYQNIRNAIERYVGEMEVCCKSNRESIPA